VRDPVISHPRRQVRPLSLLLLALLLVQTPVPARSGDSPVHGFRVVESWPHDTSAFTQGLVVVDGQPVRVHRRLRQLQPSPGAISESGEVQQVRDTAAAACSARALTAWRGELVQLTWRAGVGLALRAGQLSRSSSDFKVAGEGWGITADGVSLDRQ
jgi:glutamine cyclotransferase